MEGYFRDDDGGASPDINTTPLIDVLLVLLVMLIVTIPVPLHSLSTALPSDSAAVPPKQPPVRLTLDADGTLFWNGERLDNADGLDLRLAQLAAQGEPPALYLRVHDAVRYGRTMTVMASIQRHGLHDVNLLTNP
ncbi:ExbD/TolR family protein [Magnetospirillum aberrantis]|uniref:Biopolymer transporter ExbD n=1 Tax=Magnetospirillum aberrantis SpK TaxID=908842 RepID=A0A7C9UXQ0_9PROT|nr:biopolymer transporter ExbD [Magnetospirillum aberrantis]NFV79251.1 biopolymer transporter ExbD [Magnetospirillum aberrantis SpK]